MPPGVVHDTQTPPISFASPIPGVENEREISNVAPPRPAPAYSSAPFAALHTETGVAPDPKRAADMRGPGLSIAEEEFLLTLASRSEPKRAAPSPSFPRLQSVMCVDDRNTSIRHAGTSSGLSIADGSDGKDSCHGLRRQQQTTSRLAHQQTTSRLPPGPALPFNPNFPAQPVSPFSPAHNPAQTQPTPSLQVLGLAQPGSAPITQNIQQPISQDPDPICLAQPWRPNPPNPSHPVHSNRVNPVRANPVRVNPWVSPETDFPPLSKSNPVPPTIPSPPTRPQRSFLEAVSHISTTNPPPPQITPKQPFFHEGAPAIHFTLDEIAKLAEPFKFSLVGKFSQGRPLMEKIRAFFGKLELLGHYQISLLDQRHVLIKLTLESDFSRIWSRQIYFLEGNKPMRIFKWTPAFRCSEESPIVPVWVSLPHLPIHYLNSKEALFAIASTFGKLLRVDNATAAVIRPTVARILVEYDITLPLIPKIWISEGDSGFWQDVIFEKIPAYCTVCKHLGHAAGVCYIANPHLRKRPHQDDSSSSPVIDPSSSPVIDPAPAPAPAPSPVHEHAPNGNTLEKVDTNLSSLIPACNDLGAAPLVDTLNTHINAQVSDVPTLSSNRFPLYRSEEDRHSDDDLSDHGRPRSESNMQTLPTEDSYESDDRTDDFRTSPWITVRNRRAKMRRKSKLVFAMY